jgi:hypothetical protein
MVGAGNSRLSEEMWDDGTNRCRIVVSPSCRLISIPGYKTIDNIDISSVVVDQMREKIVDKEGLTCTRRRCIELSP